MPRIDRYLKTAVLNRASDLHLSADEPVRMRVDGDLVAVDEQEIMEANDLQALLEEILTPTETEKLGSHKNLDKSYSLAGIGNFRVNIFFTRRGIAAVLRTIPYKIPTFEQLGLPQSIAELTNLAKGLVLVTGPTGSGKSTTLAAMLNHINRENAYHILTAEDPIEFVHTSQRSLINQREIGSNCVTFADALKYALREDPDVILVGEMRDLETIGLALTAAETGHLVFGTLHTRGAGASVDRIIDSFPANQQAMIRTMLSESLAAVISQALLKRADGQGRVAAYEILVVNHAVSNLIREGKTFQIPTIMQTGKKEGMVLMDQYIQDLVNREIVTVEEASGYMENPAVLAHKAVKSYAWGPATDGKLQPAAAAKPAIQTKPVTQVQQPQPVKKPQPASVARPSIPNPVAPPPARPAAKKAAQTLQPLDLSEEEMGVHERRLDDEDVTFAGNISDLMKTANSPKPASPPKPAAVPPPFPVKKTG